MAGVPLWGNAVRRDTSTLDVPLVELVDRLLNRGVVLTGELTISVAGVDLIYLGLSVVLSSVDTIRRSGAEI
jgi:gas vesicle structural protein